MADDERQRRTPSAATPGTTDREDHDPHAQPGDRDDRHRVAHRLHVVAERDGERHRRPRSRGSRAAAASARAGRSGRATRPPPRPRPCWPAITFCSASERRRCQPEASIRLLITMLTAKKSATPMAASRSRCAAWRSSSAGIAHAGATMPVPTGAERRGRGAGGSRRGPRRGSLRASVGDPVLRERLRQQAGRAEIPRPRPRRRARVPHCGQCGGRRARHAPALAVARSVSSIQRISASTSRGVGHACAPPPRAARSAKRRRRRCSATRSVDSAEPELRPRPPRTSPLAPSPVRNALAARSAPPARRPAAPARSRSTQRASSAAVHWRSKIASGVSRSTGSSRSRSSAARGVERQLARAAAALLARARGPTRWPGSARPRRAGRCGSGPPAAGSRSR